MRTQHKLQNSELTNNAKIIITYKIWKELNFLQCYEISITFKKLQDSQVLWLLVLHVYLTMLQPINTLMQPDWLPLFNCTETILEKKKLNLVSLTLNYKQLKHTKLKLLKQELITMLNNTTEMLLYFATTSPWEQCKIFHCQTNNQNWRNFQIILLKRVILEIDNSLSKRLAVAIELRASNSEWAVSLAEFQNTKRSYHKGKHTRSKNSTTPQFRRQG